MLRNVAVVIVARLELQAQERHYQIDHRAPQALAVKLAQRSRPLDARWKQRVYRDIVSERGGWVESSELHLRLEA